MASVRQHDLAKTRAQIEEWLASVVGLGAVELSELVLPAGGVVNDTFVYDVRWTDGAGAHDQRQVLRAQPDGYSNLATNDVLGQARFLQCLALVPDLPVAKVLWVEEDTTWLGRPFYVMEAVPGEVGTDMPPYHLEGWLHDASVDGQRHVYRQGIEALARVHAIDWRAIGLGHLDEGRVGETALQRQVRLFREFQVWGAEGGEYPTLEAGYAWLVEHFPSDEGEPVLNWNDARLGNILYDDCELTALLDWELATVGPPEIDLGWFLWHDRYMAVGLASTVTGRPVAPIPGSPSREEAEGWYRAASGHAPRDMDWYETWAAYRLATYLMRHGKGMVLTGLAPADSGVDRVNSASLELARMLDLPSPGTPSGLL